jgi:hypothetical protein
MRQKGGFLFIYLCLLVFLGFLLLLMMVKSNGREGRENGIQEKLYNGSRDFIIS